MTIADIKQRLSIHTVLQYYNLRPNRNNMLNCPFHKDKTPSMQVYPETNTVFCFSFNCRLNGKAIDQIDFIMYKENCTKHEAIKKAKSLAGILEEIKPAPITKPKPVQNPTLLSRLEKTFLQSILHAKPAKDYSAFRCLDPVKLKGYIGYNSGQFHHHRQANEEDEQEWKTFIKECLETGMLQPLDKPNSRTGAPITYRVFAKDCIIFFLRNKKNEPVSLYGRNIKEGGKHYYLKNRRGLYPQYPNPETKVLLLTESIIDCATLQQIELPPNHTLLSLYGTNGLNEEHKTAILQLKHLEEIIFCLDNDEAGIKATQKHGRELQMLMPNIKLTTLELPCKDINETAQLHDNLQVFNLLIKSRIPVFKALTNQAGKPAEQAGSILPQINKLIEESGIIGEENSRLLLFIIASSYKTQNPLHALVQGSSGSGKTHLISKIADLMPQEDVLRFTRITESALYNFGEDMLVEKLLVIEDLDGLKEDALLAFRELVSNHQVNSGVSIKDKKGNIKSTTKRVRGVFSSMSATTKGAVYEDNMNRSFLLAVDESPEQSQRIIDYQNKRYAGNISKQSESNAKETLRQQIRELQDIPIVNPYATQIQLPDNVQKKRRLNEMFQCIIRQITLINQKQRPIQKGSLYTTLEDIEQSIEILFESIILKIDELEGPQRVFYEKLYKSFGNSQFTRFQAMEVTGLKKTQLQYHLNSLVELEYLQQYGFSNRGFKYKIGFEDSIEKVRKSLKQHFTNQLESLKTQQHEKTSEHQRTPLNTNRTPSEHQDFVMQ